MMRLRFLATVLLAIVSVDVGRCDGPNKGVVVCVCGRAADVGAAVLGHVGNAVDAAVATAFALSVTHPAAGNIGGGGFMVVHPARGKRGEPRTFDFREVAPKSATRDMFVNPKDRTPHRRVGVPGTVAGLALAHNKLGKLAWKDLVTPAVKLAEAGFELDDAEAKSINSILRSSPPADFAELHRVFANPADRPWRAGDRLVQPDLAKTLARVAEKGPDGVYAGPVADLLSEEMRLGGGLITKEDLANYRPIERRPLHGVYRGHDIWCMPPSSSGGTTILLALNILENFDLKKDGRWSVKTVHRIAEASRRAYRDRARYLGDPAFVEIPSELTDKAYAKKLAAGIDDRKATPSTDLAGDTKTATAPTDTTHLSVVDAGGTAVSLTYTLESSYGNRVVVRGAGYLLNNEMTDFNGLPRVTTTSGKIGTDANLVAPGKRMLSSMCSTIVSKDGKPVLVTGSPGSRTIINTVLCVVVNTIDFDMPAREAVDAPRFHHPWFPDKLRLEPATLEGNSDLRAGLEKLGHVVEIGPKQGDAHTIRIDPRTGEAIAAADQLRISGKKRRARRGTEFFNDDFSTLIHFFGCASSASCRVEVGRTAHPLRREASRKLRAIGAFSRS